MNDQKILEEFQAYCDQNLIKPRNIYFQFWRASRAGFIVQIESLQKKYELARDRKNSITALLAEVETLRKECARLEEDNRGLLQDFEGAL